MTATPQLVDTAPLLPCNIEAERCILGSVIVDGRALDVAVERIRSEDYFLIQHRHIFEGMLRLRGKQQPIDTVTLIEELRIGDVLESAGGVAYVSQIADSLPRMTDASILNYARIVREKSALRRLIHTAADIQQQAFSGGDDPDVILSRAREALANLETSASPDALFDTWEEFKNAKPLRSLIENVFHADVCNMIGGLSGDGKTLILFSITKALLTGQPLFGYFKVLEMAPRVVYLIPECARAPFLHRAKIFGLDKYLENGRLLVRTLSKGPRINLNDPRLLNVVKGAVVHIDTAVRFSTGGENDADAISSGLAMDIFGLIAAGAAAIGGAHHAPKSFETQNRITLENILRGSGDIGAFVGAGFGIRQIDEQQIIIHLEDVKPRDSELFPPFQIIGRPYINDEGDFRVYRKPGECGPLADYLEIPGKKGGASIEVQQARSANVEICRRLVKEDPKASSEQIAQRFATFGIEIKASTIRNYRKDEKF